MKTTLLTLTFALLATPVWAAEAPAATTAIVGDAAAGQQKALVCSACHGMDGNSMSNPEWPTIAGQHEKYITKQLRNYRSGAKNEDGVVRNNALMAGQAIGLSDQDIADLSAYFTAQAMQRTKGASPEMVALGETLYRSGDLTRGIAACSGCHGPNGTGNAEAMFPNLAGQHAEYTALQLTNFRAGHRANDPGKMMRAIAVKMTDEQIQAVATYIQGLRPTQVQANR